MRRLRDYWAALGPSVKTIRVDIPEARHHPMASCSRRWATARFFSATSGWRGVTKSEWEGKARELQLDHVAADGFISLEEAERTIQQAYGPKPCDDEESPAAANHHQQSRV